MRSRVRDSLEGLKELFDTLDLDGPQKRFLSARWLDQVTWADRRALWAQRWHYSLRMTTIIGGVLAPALFSLDRPSAHVVASAISLLVAASAATDEFFHFGERWRHYRLTSETLKTEGWRFVELAPPYSRHGHRGYRDAFPAFADKVERIIVRDVQVYLSKIVEEPEEEQEKTVVGEHEQQPTTP